MKEAAALVLLRQKLSELRRTTEQLSFCRFLVREVGSYFIFCCLLILFSGLSLMVLTA